MIGIFADLFSDTYMFIIIVKQIVMITNDVIN